MSNQFYALRDEPFRLLHLLEQRCRAVTQGVEATSERHEWVGIAFRIGNEVFLTSRADVREVIGVLPSTRVPGTKVWLRGLANLRSQLLPIIDLSRFAGGHEHRHNPQERLLVVNHPKIPAGLIVDEVIGFRRFTETELFKGKTANSDYAGLNQYVLGTCERNDNVWSVLGLKKLVESPEFLQASAAN